MSTPRIRALLATLCVAATSGLAIMPASPGTAVAASAANDAGSQAGGLTTLGLKGWEVQSSAIANQGGQQISTPGFPTDNWLDVVPDDAGAPGTEIEALLQNGACPDVFLNNNMRKCFGYESGWGPETLPRFKVPWWFRTDFTRELQPDQHAKLIINGIVGQADVWVDGVQVASQATVQGAYTRYTFDITRLLRAGLNSLALEVHANDPSTMFTSDTVDWNQVPPDNNTGIQFPVQLDIAGALGIGNAHVIQANAPDLSSTELTLRADVTNNTSSPQTGIVSAVVTPPTGAGGPIRVWQLVTVPANDTVTVGFAPPAYPGLTIAHPRVWWPYQMGGQPLYTLSTAVAQHHMEAGTAPESFGIRTVTSYLTAPGKLTPKGVRVYAINGRPFVFRAGGWSEQLFLHYSSRDAANQIALIRNLGLNGIRTEGKQMPDDFYRQMDKAGLLIDAGFQCCDAWEPSGPGSLTAHDYAILYLSALTIGENMRNHPSVFTFSWSDNAPFKKQEAVTLQGFAQADFREPIIASAEYKNSPILGWSGEKEGPYDWVPPSYWYDTTHRNGDSSLTNAGGSWGFDSEQSAGDTVPTLDSLRRFMEPLALAELSQDPTFHPFHTNYETTGHSGYAFGTLYNMDIAVRNRYGPWSSLEQFVEEAQVQNYENTRSQFEAFIDHWTNTPSPSTGIVYWQLNKGWPSLLWTLYNSDYDQAGSFFGTKKANDSLHVLYAYDNGTVTVDNLTGATQSDLSVSARVYDLAGNVLDDQVAHNVSLPSQGVLNRVLTPKVPAPTAPPTPAQAYFIELSLKRSGIAVDRNVYWLSTQSDVVKWGPTLGNPQAVMAQFADMRQLQTLGQATVTATASSRRHGGSNGDTTVTTVTITNTSRTPIVGFFLRADVRRGDAAGAEQSGDNQVLPITWSDNDITLWPGESETLTAAYDSSSLHGAAPVVSIFGWNVPRFVVPATGGSAP